jgi:arsenate reductase
LLNDRGIPFTYREYRKEPLTEAELSGVLAKLGLSARDILRKRDKAAAGLTGDEGDDVLVPLMAANPTMVQRPIGVLGDRAVLGRPIENLLTLSPEGG